MNNAYSLSTICKIVNGKFIQQVAKYSINHLVYDSRNISFADQSLFFALLTSRANGHLYILNAYQKGIRNFIVSEEVNVENLKEATVIFVDDTLQALQQLASFHRSQFSIPVIGITGSNGKTVVKEWLYQLLQDDFRIVRSPKSYNSQIGVPLSVWQIQPEHTLAIFEAGISQTGEMSKLAKIIQPTIGIITNVGEAHSSGFSSVIEKTEEKLQLIQNAEVMIYCREALPVGIEMNHTINVLSADTNLLNWSFTLPAACRLQTINQDASKTYVSFVYKEKTFSIIIPFRDDASVQNAVHCFCVMMYLGYSNQIINERFSRLHSVDMRLEIKNGINECVLINDSYSADITSLEIALSFQEQQASGLNKTVILSDFLQSNKTEEKLYGQIAAFLYVRKIEKVIVIGEKIQHYFKKESFLKHDIEFYFYDNTEAFLQKFQSSSFHRECILIKGARRFRFEQIVQQLERKVHQTILEVNLNAIAHNLKEYQKNLHPQTRIMAMVKAFAYGSGGAEIARVLQFNNIDYLGVAYADEGIDLRKAGISVPIMVMNVDSSSFGALTEFNLHPVIYSFQLLTHFEDYLKEQGLNSYPVHIEIESGMNRLGFSLGEINKVAEHLKSFSFIKIETVFSHLAASEDPAQDVFTNEQAIVFEKATSILNAVISYSFLKHIANSAAIIRHPNLQMDMVRLGIGLYGIEISTHQLNLQPVATLRSTIAQLKILKAGQTVSYNRSGIVKDDIVIATVRIGYADGYSRQFSNGVGKMWINGKLAPVVGAVCMDMTMIDVTDIKGVNEGDEVIIFGKELPLQLMAEWANIIPYEIMTSVSQRVKRVYFQE